MIGDVATGAWVSFVAVSAKAGEHTESRKIAVSAVFGKDIVVLGKLFNWLGAAN